jgi:hypothetical protein
MALSGLDGRQPPCPLSGVKRTSNLNRAMSAKFIVNSLIKCENTLPVVLHANDRPAILLGFII